MRQSHQSQNSSRNPLQDEPVTHHSTSSYPSTSEPSTPVAGILLPSRRLLEPNDLPVSLWGTPTPPRSCTAISLTSCKMRFPMSLPPSLMMFPLRDPLPATSCLTAPTKPSPRTPRFDALPGSTSTTVTGFSSE